MKINIVININLYMHQTLDSCLILYNKLIYSALFEIDKVWQVFEIKYTKKISKDHEIIYISAKNKEVEQINELKTLRYNKKHS